MIEIKDLLSRFEDILVSEEGKKGCVVDAIKKAVNVTVKTKDIEIKNGTIYLNIKPIYKNTIFLKKSEIMEEIESCLGKKSPKQMR